jgi:hypothetical protein
MAALSPQVILIAFWLIVLVIAAFSLRMACSLCKVDMPSWRRAFVSVVVVTFLAYLTFDFTCYLVMRSMDGVYLRVPQGYGYGQWFSEPINVKWYIVSQSGFLKHLPFVFALCVAGVLQLAVLQAQVTFRFGLLIFLLQWAATGLAGYIVSLLFGVALSSMGWTPPQPAVAPETAQAKPGPGEAAQPKATDSGATLQVIQRQTQEALEGSKDYLTNAGKNLKAYADSHLEELKEIARPVTQHLPEPVRSFLDQGGWWLVLGALAVLALLWLRSIVRKLRGDPGPPPKTKKGKKKRTWSPPDQLRENLAHIGPSVTEPGPTRIVVKGLPAELRLVVLSLGTKGDAGLSEEMADRVLDWIKRGLAEVASFNRPAVRVWPPFYSDDGFALSVQSHIRIPGPKGVKSRWVVLAGAVRMGQSVLHVALALYAEEENNLGFLRVKGERWLDCLALEKTPESARY